MSPGGGAAGEGAGASGGALGGAGESEGAGASGRASSGASSGAGEGAGASGGASSGAGESERVRLFVALDLPDSALTALIAWRDRVLPPSSGVRPLARDTIHVTLCFLGWRAAAEIPAIGEACRVLSAQPGPELAFGEPVWLPRRQPRALAVELRDHGERLTGTQAVLSQVLAAGGWYAPEKRPYLPHVTVARLRAASRRRLAPPPPLAFPASHVVLYRSRLQRGGARYEALDTFELSTP